MNTKNKGKDNNSNNSFGFFSQNKDFNMPVQNTGFNMPAQNTSFNLDQNNNDLKKYLEYSFNTILDIQSNVKEIKNNLIKNDVNIIHNIQCSSCLKQIYGYRYKCIICADYNICSECENKIRKKEISHTEEHLFLKLHYNINTKVITNQDNLNNGIISLQFSK